MAAEEKGGSAPTGMIWLNLTGDLPLFRRNGKHTGVRVSACAEGPDNVGRMDPHIRCFTGGWWWGRSAMLFCSSSYCADNDWDPIGLAQGSRIWRWNRVSQVSALDGRGAGVLSVIALIASANLKFTLTSG